MKDYVEHKMWSDLEVTSPVDMWVASRLLNIPPELISKYRRTLPSLIYRVFFSLEYNENSYVTAYNGSRADVIAEIIEPVDDDKRIIRIDSEPLGDISYWLASHVLRFSDLEISVMCSVPLDNIRDPDRDLLPLIKSCYRILKKEKLSNPLLQHYHRSRHLMIRYYLDAVYHEL